MDPKTLWDQKQKLTLLDVRTPEEFDSGHIEGSMHIPVDELSSRIAEIPAGRRVVTVCASGERSALAAEMLAQSGIDADTLEGGVERWKGQGLPLVGGEDQEMSPELEALKEDFLAITFAMNEKFGDREPTQEESLAFLKEWLMAHKGLTPEEAQSVVEEY